MALREVLRNACLRNSQGLVWAKNIKKFEGLDETREFLVLREGCIIRPLGGPRIAMDYRVVVPMHK